MRYLEISQALFIKLIHHTYGTCICTLPCNIYSWCTFSTLSTWWYCCEQYSNKYDESISKHLLFCWQFVFAMICVCNGIHFFFHCWAVSFKRYRFNVGTSKSFLKLICSFTLTKCKFDFCRYFMISCARSTAGIPKQQVVERRTRKSLAAVSCSLWYLSIWYLTCGFSLGSDKQKSWPFAQLQFLHWIENSCIYPSYALERKCVYCGALHVVRCY